MKPLSGSEERTVNDGADDATLVCPCVDRLIETQTEHVSVVLLTHESLRVTIQCAHYIWKNKYIFNKV